jgi:hypothetical protein
MAEISGDQKKKLFILAGFLGFLMIVGFIALQPRGGDTETTVAATPPPATGAPASTSAAPPAATSAPAASATKAAPKATPVKLAAKPRGPLIDAPRRTSVDASRPDPFEPHYYPMPTPEPTPTPAPPPVQLPAPPSVPLPSPGQPSNAPPSTALVGLPSPHIGRYAQMRGPRWFSSFNTPRGSSDSNIVPRSPNKRLAGVVIGDGVRALLEIQVTDTATGGGESGAAGAATSIVRVVQPGDEVDGIKILKISREYENGKQITRMYIREGGEDRYVDLRQAPTPPAAAAGGGEGFSSGSGSGGPPSPPFGAIRPAFPRGNRPID